jgi:hypothetical protein
MTTLVEQLEDLKGGVNDACVFHPRPSAYADELLFFARLFADLTAPAPDYAALETSYWNRVYRIYDTLPGHVDPRPRTATKNLIQHFAKWV